MKNKKFKKFWKQIEWENFSNKVIKRDSYQCLKCNRDKNEVILQVHHEIYRPNKKPWEYAISDCITLCKGCHAKEHKIIEPTMGWFLLEINDLGELSGICQRENCGNNIRYEHLTYHPNWGYKIVGSTCIQHLTEKDKLLSSEIIKSYKQISKFVTESIWENGFTKKCKKFIKTNYKHHQIRIYEENNTYSFQIAIKEKGVRWFDYKKPIFFKNKCLEEVKELAYIVLRGTISENENEKLLLRNIYKNII